jgi:hypothetical protein
VLFLTIRISAFVHSVSGPVPCSILGRTPFTSANWALTVGSPSFVRLATILATLIPSFLAATSGCNVRTTVSARSFHGGGDSERGAVSLLTQWHGRYSACRGGRLPAKIRGMGSDRHFDRISGLTFVIGLIVACFVAIGAAVLLLGPWLIREGFTTDVPK